MNVDPLVRSFNAGELSPLLDGRSDLVKYQQGCRTLKNMVPTPYGAAVRRPGTYKISSLDWNNEHARLIPFAYSVDEVYIIELGDQYIRVYEAGDSPAPVGWLYADLDSYDTSKVYNINDAVVYNNDGYLCLEDGVTGTWDDTKWRIMKSYLVPDCLWNTVSSTEFFLFEIASPYLEADLAAIQTIQMNDVLWLVHNGYAPRQLKRYGSHDWRLETITFTGGPFLPENETDTPLKSSVYTGSGTLTVVKKNDVPDVRAQYTHATKTISAAAGTFNDLSVGDYVYIDGVTNPPKVTDGSYQVTAKAADGSSITCSGIVSTADDAVDVYFPKADLEAKTYTHADTRVTGTAGDFNDVEVGDWVYLDDQAGTNLTDGYYEVTDKAADASWIECSGAVSTGDSADVDVYFIESVFSADMVGSLMRVSHYRDVDDCQVSGHATTANYVFQPLRVIGGVDVTTLYNWTGSVYLQKRIGVDGPWETIRTFYSGPTGAMTNYTYSEDVDEPVAYVRIATGPDFTGDVYVRYGSRGSRADGVVQITAYNSPISVDMTVIEDLYATTATKYWAEGAWSDKNGYPAAIEACAGRIVYGGSVAEPQTIWRSRVDDYDDMWLGTGDDKADSYTIMSGTQNAIRWIKAVGGALVIGTRGGEHILRPAEGEVLSATNLEQEQQSAYGSAAIQAVMLHGAIFFVEREGSRVRAMQYAFESDSYRSQDATILAEHIAKAGIVQVAVQTQPMSILWCVLADGTLASMTYEPDHDVQAWHRHETEGDVVGIAVVPTSGEDQVWVAVKRAWGTAGNQWQVHVERLWPFDYGDDLADSCFVDSAVVFDGFIASGLTYTSSNQRITGPANTFDNFQVGDYVQVDVTSGPLTAGRYAIAEIAADDSWIRLTNGPATGADSTVDVYASPTVLYGLKHLYGLEVDVLANGVIFSGLTVGASGDITLSSPVTHAIIGLPYESVVRPTRIDIDSQRGTGYGKVRRAYEVALSFYETQKPSIGTTEDDYREITLGDDGTAVWTGCEVQAVDDDFNKDGDLFIVQDNPLPMTIRSMAPRLEFSDA